jgi:hypothetical protein
MKKEFGVRYDLNEIMGTISRLSARFLGPDYRTNEAYRAYMYHETVMKDLRKSY